MPEGGVPHTSFPLPFGRYLNDNTVEAARKETRQVMPRTAAFSPDKNLSGEPIKTDMELAIVF